MNNPVNPTIKWAEPPAGCRRDAKGRFIPEDMIKPVDKLRDELVNTLVQKAQETSKALGTVKSVMLSEIQDFIALSWMEYNTQVGSEKGNMTLMTFDGRYKIQISVSDRMCFDERVHAAKNLIDECIHTWSKGSSDEIKVLVQSAFQVDKEGKVSTGRVLELRRLDIKDEKWQLAMQAISESLQVIGSKEYVRFYEKVGDDKWQHRPSLTACYARAVRGGFIG